ncbi:MAG: ABC transporter [Opitutae bacterium]|nr:ABC transporter [Opitutae bacterium]MEC8421242.1 ABC transporter ATP-binding protein [Verrucomicrobiota bacterium]
MNDILQTEKLTKRFSSVLAVDSLSFALRQGSITALLGGNGAGKTTTLSMLLGLLEPTSGKISLFGQDFIRNRYNVLGRMNFSSPYVDLPQRLTVRENLTVYARLYGVADVRERIETVSSEFRLQDLLDRRVRRLSSGQKTRVSLAKSLINRPEFLLLDEPTASLDPDTTVWIRDFLKNYRDTYKATILFASHDMREVQLLCDEVLLMKRGKIVEEGSPQELLLKHGKDDLEQVFLDVSREEEA